MRVRNLAIALLTIACLPMADARAQRRPLLGTVVDLAGEPVANACVRGICLPLDADSLAAGDVVAATTDERGRFRLSVLPCSPYQLWAIGPADESGKRLVSKLTAASAGSIVELRAAVSQGPRTVKVNGTAAWQEVAPLHLSLGLPSTDTEHVEAWTSSSVPIDDDGIASLPPLPDGYVPYEIRDRSSNLLTSSRLSANQDQVTIVLHPPQTVPMVVVDAEGAPIQGAVIRQRFRHGHLGERGNTVARPSIAAWRTLGETDAEGRLTATISRRKPPFEDMNWESLFFLAEKTGRAPSHSGFTQHPFLDGKEIARERVTELRFTLREPQPFAGRLLRSADSGVADQQVTVHFGIKVVTLEGNGWQHESLELRATTDADGRFTIEDAPHEFFEADVLLAGATMREQFVPKAIQRMTPIDAVALHRLRSRPAKELQLHVGAMPMVQLQLLNQTGGPAAGAGVLLVSLADSEIDCDTWTPSATTDSAGRVAMLVQPGKWFLFARHEGGMSYQHLDVEADTQLERKLEPMPSMRGRVVDGAGKPLAGATLNCHTASWHSGGNRDEGLEAIANSMNWHWISTTTTDANGNFVCHFLELDGMTYEARCHHGGKQSKEFPVVAGEEPVTIVIE